jgi:hypothetical protein
MIVHFREAPLSLGSRRELYFRKGEMNYAIQSQLCD